MSSNVLQANGTKTAAKWSHLWDTECSHLAWRRGGRHFRNSFWLCVLDMLAGGGSVVRCEEMDSGRDVPDPHLLLSFNGACSFPDIACFNSSILQQDNKIPAETKQFPLTNGAKVTHPFQWHVSLQTPVGIAFPRPDGARCSQIHGGTWGNGCFPQLPPIPSWKVPWQLSPGLMQCNRPSWLIIQMH